MKQYITSLRGTQKEVNITIGRMNKQGEKIVNVLSYEETYLGNDNNIITLKVLVEKQTKEGE